MVHVGAFNLSLILRKLLEAGTPRELKSRAEQVFSRLLRSLPCLIAGGFFTRQHNRPTPLRIANSFRCRTPRHRSRIFRSSATGRLTREVSYSSDQRTQPRSKSSAGTPVQHLYMT